MKHTDWWIAGLIPRRIKIGVKYKGFQKGWTMLIGKEANDENWESLELETAKVGVGVGNWGSAEWWCEMQPEGEGSWRGLGHRWQWWAEVCLWQPRRHQRLCMYPPSTGAWVRRMFLAVPVPGEKSDQPEGSWASGKSLSLCELCRLKRKSDRSWEEGAMRADGWDGVREIRD